MKGSEYFQKFLKDQGGIVKRVLNSCDRKNNVMSIYSQCYEPI